MSPSTKKKNARPRETGTGNGDRETGETGTGKRGQERVKKCRFAIPTESAFNNLVVQNP